MYHTVNDKSKRVCEERVENYFKYYNDICLGGLTTNDTQVSSSTIKPGIGSLNPKKRQTTAAEGIVDFLNRSKQRGYKNFFSVC
jgi:hypothetical protein